MTPEDDKNEFRRTPQLRVQMELTREQYAAMKEWSASIPTLYFLDICVANITKPSATLSDGVNRKSAMVERLRELDRPQHSFSYLLALMEKVSDTRGTLSDDELEKQILGDVGALRTFFKSARVVEPDAFLIGYTKDLRKAAPELSRAAYLRFLQAANDRFALRDPVAPALRLQKAKQLLEAADAMSVRKQHPVVLVTLACLYGNRSAKKLMKFKADPGQFNDENALADIMVIGRFASLKLELEQGGRLGRGNVLRSDFVTDDDGLYGILSCFEAQVVRYEPRGYIQQKQITVNVNFEPLFPDLNGGGSDGPPIDERTDSSDDEFQQLCALLAQQASH